MPTARMRRVNQVIREVVGDALVQDLSDPRIGFVTVTEVDTSPDLSQARVYVSVLGEEEDRADALRGLRSARGVFQQRIADELRIKRTPKLLFEYDETAERADRVSRLLDE